MKKKNFTPKHTYCESAVDCTAYFHRLSNCLANFFLFKNLPLTVEFTKLKVSLTVIFVKRSSDHVANYFEATSNKKRRFLLKKTVTVKCGSLSNIKFTAQLIDRQTYKNYFSM